MTTGVTPEIVHMCDVPGYGERGPRPYHLTVCCCDGRSGLGRAPEAAASAALTTQSFDLHSLLCRLPLSCAAKMQRRAQGSHS
jgi:hypothetical protein